MLLFKFKIKIQYNINERFIDISPIYRTLYYETALGKLFRYKCRKNIAFELSYYKK